MKNTMRKLKNQHEIDEFHILQTDEHKCYSQYNGQHCGALKKLKKQLRPKRRTFH